MKENKENQMVATELRRDGISATALRHSLKGQVLVSGDEGYDQARTTFYGGFDRRPAMIIRAADAGDVTRAILLARETGLPLAVRSGGHSVAGFSVVEGGIVLDLHDMRSLEIDVEGRTAWAEPGLTAGEYVQATGEHGLVTGFGDTGSVGIGGITLGGGVGYLSRKFGLTIDDLLAAEVVTADGALHFVDAEHHPDLFWALRGGGGNFGVVTRFHFRLHPLPSFLGGMLILPATAENITAFLAAAGEAPDELGTIANVMPAPPMPFLPAELHGKLVIFAMLAYAGPVEAGQEVMARFRAIDTPLADMIRPMQYTEMFPPEEGGYRPTAVSRTMYVQKIDLEAARTIMKYLQSSDAPMRVAQLRALGGAISRVPVEATAFAHRQAPVMVNLAAFYNGPEDKALREQWVTDFARELDQGYSGVYVNFLEDDRNARVRDAYPGGAYEKLAAIKARYDPNNLFRLNQNITPAKRAAG